MHCVLLGVCRHLLKLWTNKSNHNSPWYIGKDVKLVDKRLLLIKPPSEIRRTPRSIEDTLKFWKGAYVHYSDWVMCTHVHVTYYLIHMCNVAHELRAWLLHYSPVVLHGILPSDYYHSFLLKGCICCWSRSWHEETSNRAVVYWTIIALCFLFCTVSTSMYITAHTL